MARIPKLDSAGKFLAADVNAQIDARTKATMRADLPALAKELKIGGGMPEGGQPGQVLTTGPDGKAVWAKVDGGTIKVGGAAPADGWWLDNGGVETVTAKPPTFDDKDGASADTYTIPTTAGVEYLVGGAVKAAGTYPASGTVTVTARATAGYALAGQSSWTFTFSAEAAPVAVTPTAPTASDTTDTYTIPSVTGVEYLVGGAVKAAGTYSVGDVDATVTVTARATSGYVLSGQSSWTFTFTKKPVAPIPSGAYYDALLADAPALYLPLDDAAGTTSPRVLGAYAAFNTFSLVGSTPPTFGAPGIGDGATALSKTVPQSGVLSEGAQVMKSATSAFLSGITAWSMEIIAADMATTAIHEGIAPVFGFTQAMISAKKDGTIIGPSNLTSPSGTGGALAARKHIAYTFDGTTARLYVNGVEAVSSTTQKPSFTSQNKFGLDVGNGWAPTGRYAGMACYDKALTPDRVLAHAKAAGLA